MYLLQASWFIEIGVTSSLGDKQAYIYWCASLHELPLSLLWHKGTAGWREVNNSSNFSDLFIYLDAAPLIPAFILVCALTEDGTTTLAYGVSGQTTITTGLPGQGQLRL